MFIRMWKKESGWREACWDSIPPFVQRHSKLVQTALWLLICLVQWGTQYTYHHLFYIKIRSMCSDRLVTSSEGLENTYANNKYTPKLLYRALGGQTCMSMLTFQELFQKCFFYLGGNKWVSDGGVGDWEPRDRERYPGLHKNTSHAYSQNVLSFMLEREGKDVHTEG